jgi:Domain of unknown function (DUF4389)
VEPNNGADGITEHDVNERALVPTDGTGRNFPITFRFDPPERVAHWRPLVNWLLAIPHLIVLYLLRIAAEVLSVLAWFMILFTGNMSPTFVGFLAMYIRYEQRVWTYAGFLREEYPPFTFDSTAADPGNDPRVRVEVVPALERRNRLTVGFRLILFIPWAIVLVVYAIAASAVFIVAWFAVLFTGRWPEGMRTFVLKVARFYVRTSGFLLLLTDEYPPFALE